MCTSDNYILVYVLKSLAKKNITMINVEILQNIEGLNSYGGTGQH